MVCIFVYSILLILKIATIRRHRQSKMKEVTRLRRNMALTSSSFPLPSLSGQLHCCWGNRDSWKRRNQPEKEKWNEEGGERKGKTIYENILITNDSFTDISVGDLCWRWECLLLRNTDYWRRRSHTLLNTPIIYLSRMAFSQQVLNLCVKISSPIPVKLWSN